jgi:hypothetical protein
VVRIVVIAVALTCAAAACSSDTPAATGGAYCAAISADLAQLNAPAIADAAGIEATATLYNSIAALAPLAVQKEWKVMSASVETASSVDPADAASVQRAADTARASQNSATAIVDYTSKVCGITIGIPTSTALPPVDATPAPSG